MPSFRQWMMLLPRPCTPQRHSQTERDPTLCTRSLPMFHLRSALKVFQNKFFTMVQTQPTSNRVTAMSPFYRWGH